MACEFTIHQVVEATGGRVLSTVEKAFVGVGTDTRDNLQNQIFVALKGDEHDAHKFLAKAAEQGARCLLIHDEAAASPELLQKVSVVLVPDTLLALQAMAKYWRKKLTGKVLAITGSNGKSTTKEFVAAILATQFKVHANRGSFNNHWGVPLTLLGASQFDQAIIVEMGMNHRGELAMLSKIATPDVVICTTVGRAHIGNFDGSQQGIADAKEEIYLSNPRSVKIFNYDNEYTIKMFERVSKLQGTEKTIVFSSFSAGAEVNLRAAHMDLDGLQIAGQIGGVKGESKVPVFGRQNVTNLMAAASLALAMNMASERVWAALPKCQGQWGRNQLLKLENGTRILFDAYNANPDSTAVLIKNMFELNLEKDGKKIAILGEMLELGDGAEKFHHEIGEMLGNTDVGMVWFMGPSRAAFEAGLKKNGWNKKFYSSAIFDEKIAAEIQGVLRPRDLVFMKGSRGMKLEQVVKKWVPSFHKPKN